MPQDRVYNYEGFFLFPQSAIVDLQSAVDHVRGILGNYQGQVLSLFKWDERRLAYEIRGNKRGVYLLAYFRAPASRMKEIERACNLSEQLLRTMVIRADHLSDEQMKHAEREQALADEIRLRREQPQVTTVPPPAPPAPPASAAPAHQPALATSGADDE